MNGNLMREYKFREIDGIWRDVLDKNGDILADVLKQYEIIMDDRTQFARLYDYERMMCFWYRNYACGHITLHVYRLRQI